MSDLEEVTSEKKSGISRRTVAKGMAWSVPAVALAVAAPAYAASPCTPVFSFGAASCKCPGGSDPIKFGYVLQFCFTVAAQCALPPGGTTATIIAIENNSGKPLTPINDPYPIDGPDHRRSELLERRGPLHVGEQRLHADHLVSDQRGGPRPDAGGSRAAAGLPQVRARPV